MELFGRFISAGYDVMQIPIPLFGYTFTFWQVFMFTVVGSAVVGLIYGIFK